MKHNPILRLILIIILICSNFINVFAAEDITLRETKTVAIPSYFISTPNTKYQFEKTVILDNGTKIRSATLRILSENGNSWNTLGNCIVGYSSKEDILFSITLNDYATISVIRDIKSIRDLHDGTFLVCAGDNIFRISYTGALLWVKNYTHEANGEFIFTDSINGRDGYLYALGYYIPNRSKSYYTILLKYDFNGNLVDKLQIRYDDYARSLFLTLSMDHKTLNVFFENPDEVVDYVGVTPIDLSTFSWRIWYSSKSSYYNGRYVVIDDYNAYVIGGGGGSSASSSDDFWGYFNGEYKQSKEIYLRSGYDSSGFTLYGVLVDNERVVTITGGLTSIFTGERKMSYSYYDKDLNLIKRDNFPLTMPLDYSYINYIDSKGLLYGELISSTQNKLYVYGPPLPTVSVSTSTSNIGDNTPIMFEVNTTGSYSYLYIHDVTNNIGIWSGAAHTPVRLDLDFEGNKSILVQILDTDWSLLNTSNVLTFNKRNVLNRAYLAASNKTGLQNFIVIDDVQRYFENNAANQKLVADIKAKASGTFLIYNDVSDVLTPLLKP